MDILLFFTDEIQGEQKETTLEFVERIPITPLTSEQSTKARERWRKSIRKVKLQQRVVHTFKGKSVVRRARKSIWNMLTHHQITHFSDAVAASTVPNRTALQRSNTHEAKGSATAVEAGTNPRQRSQTGAASPKGRLARLARSPSIRQPRKSHVMIAFGGGLLMSHSMSHKKLKSLGKSGEHRPGMKSYVLRALSNNSGTLRGR